MAVFALWFILLTGTLANFMGPPGILQGIKLRNLLKTRQVVLAELQKELQTLHLETARLETSRSAQVREIRRVLGYAAADELIFDFTNSD